MRAAHIGPPTLLLKPSALGNNNSNSRLNRLSYYPPRTSSFSYCTPKCRFSSSGDARSATTPFDILGVPHDCTLEDIKTAFRLKVKEYHPDVYKGQEDAGAITQRLIEAYELLSRRVGQSTSPRKSLDPFDNPECEAQDVFVYELECIGRGCPYSCVERAPSVFKFATETGCARAVVQAPSDDYQVQLAVGQCPRNCIYYVTPLQREALERVLERALEGTFYSNEIALLESLLARAQFENGRYHPPKREAKTSTEWVDWY